MSRLDPVVLDYETEGIDPRPHYPPKPVGVAIHEPGHDPQYLAWGHPEGNNCSRIDALRRLKPLYQEAKRDGGRALVFHHAKFDLDVSEVHLGLKPPDFRGFEDTMFELFLDDPHSRELSLKPAAERYLGLKPIERDALREWIIAHVPEAKGKPKSWRDWGRYICRAPGDLVGRYAIGDVVRTGRLHRKLHHRVIVARGMRTPYEREKRLQPILIAAERAGIPVNVAKLRRDADPERGEYTKVLARADDTLRRMIGAPGLSIDSDEDLARALQRSKHVDNGAWLYTAKGNISTAKASIDAAVAYEPLKLLLRYRAALATCLRTFLYPWLEQALVTGGLVHTRWNQVRQADGADPFGARTGRLSSSPNFQNVPVRLFIDLEGRPLPLPKGFPPLPRMRDYFIPPRGDAWLKRDYSQQEFRILGHYEDGQLLQEYLANPRMDVHDTATRMINEMLRAEFQRRQVKDIGFGLLYGMGIPKLAKKAGTDMVIARKLKRAYLSVFPGLKDLIDGLKECARNDEPLVTWGGRQYYCEEPRMIEGQLRTFEYKMLNYLIQGSASDCTKEALIIYDEARRDGTFRLTVHDEINATAPKATWEREMGILRDAMAAVPFDVPMLSDGSWSPRSWGEAKDLPE